MGQAGGAAALTISAEFPKAFSPLFESKARYLCFWGGRGSGKSWAVARALLIKGMQGGLRVLCTREVQSSIKDSVHKLLKDQIEALGLKAFYRVLDDQIRGPGGTEFIFKGLRDPDTLKSAESVGVCWVEEAGSVTKHSWEILVPTIRKPGSQIIVTFNAMLEKDETYQRFVVNPSPNAEVHRVSWRQNPWFSQELRDEMEHLKATDYDAYLNVYEGHCKWALEGAVFAEELRALAAEDRITEVPYLPGKPVHTFWDLGYADHTSIWFAQVVGFRYHVIDYYENNRQLTDHYLQALQNRPYFYGTDWLPHDAQSNAPGVERTVERQMRDAGRHVRIVPKVSVVDRINAGRTIMPVCVFDRQRTSKGLDRLRAWRYGLNEVKGKWTQNPIHDESSHAGDAFTYMGVALKGDTQKPKVAKQGQRNRPPRGQSWMSR